MDKLKIIFKSWVFYLYLGGFFMLFNFITTGNVFSFGSFSSLFSKQSILNSSMYVRNGLVDDTALSLVYLNLKVGNGDISSNQLLGTALLLNQQAQDLINIDTVTLLESSSNKEQIYDLHLKEIIDLNNQIQTLLTDILEVAESKRSESDRCLNDKNASDSIFFNGLSNNDVDLLQDGLDNSKNSSICYQENRVLSNAHYAVYDKLDYYNQLLGKKRSILDDNKELILNNFQNFKNNYFEQLIFIRDSLNNYKGD